MAPADRSLCKHGVCRLQPVQMAFLFEVLSFTWRKCEIRRDKFELILVLFFFFFSLCEAVRREMQKRSAQKFWNQSILQYWIAGRAVLHAIVLYPKYVHTRVLQYPRVHRVAGSEHSRGMLLRCAAAAASGTAISQPYSSTLCTARRDKFIALSVVCSLQQLFSCWWTRC